MAVTRCIAKALILDNDNNFLLLTRSESHPRLAGFYDLPGGMVGDDEYFTDAVMREVFEETGIKLSRDDMKVLYATTMLIKGKSYPTLVYCSQLEESSPVVTISWEHQRYEWAPLEKLAEVEPQVAPTYREALQYIQSNNILEDISTKVF